MGREEGGAHGSSSKYSFTDGAGIHFKVGPIATATKVTRSFNVSPDGRVTENATPVGRGGGEGVQLRASVFKTTYTYKTQPDSETMSKLKNILKRNFETDKK